MRAKLENKREKTRTAYIRAKNMKAALTKHHESKNAWFGVGLTGIIGFSVIVPTLLGVALGTWLDQGQQGSHPWTIVMLLIGLTIGCLGSWHWVTRQIREMQSIEK